MMIKFKFFLIELSLLLSNLIDRSTSDAPDFISGFGLTVRSSKLISNQLYEVFVSSGQVLGDQQIRIIVPPDYVTSGSSRRYPTLYLLHGSNDNGTAWTTKGEAQTICNNVSLITVMPNADPFGFYTNWIVPGNSTPQNWMTYHMEQLVPWIDLNLRTVAKKQGRAIAGLSMGGYGSIHYAEFYANNFIYAASFSGALDILDPSLQQDILDLPGDGKPFIGPFGYPSDPITSTAWFTDNPITYAAELRDMSVAIYTGNVGHTETMLRVGSYRLRDILMSFEIPVYFDDYGNGQSIGHGCDGSHSWPCWNGVLIDVLPRMMAVLAQQH